MISADFIKELDRLSREAAGAQYQPVHPEQEPDHVYFMGGERVTAAPQPRKHTAMDLDTIAKFAAENKESAVWYHRTGIVCIIHEPTRRDVVRLPLTYSPQMKTVMEWGKGLAFKQPQLILTLRTMFKSCLTFSPKLIDLLRHVRFKTNSDGTSNVVGPGKRSIGKVIEAEVTGIEQIPEDFILHVPVFDGPLTRSAQVEIALEMDAASETFTLIPIPGAVEKAIVEGEAWIREKLSDELGEYDRLYYGVP